MDHRAEERELLDGPLDDRATLVGNLRDLRRLNRLFGGVALSRWGVNTLLDGRAGASTVLDVGTGGADIPAALLADARRRGRELEITAVDSRPEVIAAALVARPGLDGLRGLRLGTVDPIRLPFADRSFDIAHASLVVHHLDEPAAIAFLRELGRVARGVVVNDLAPGRLGWLGAWLATRVLTRNRYTRHDAPLSVRRAYTIDQLEGLLRRAGLRPIDRRRTFPGYRHAIVAVAGNALDADGDPV